MLKSMNVELFAAILIIVIITIAILSLFYIKWLGYQEVNNLNVYAKVEIAQKYSGLE